MHPHNRPLMLYGPFTITLILGLVVVGLFALAGALNRTTFDDFCRQTHRQHRTLEVMAGVIHDALGDLPAYQRRLDVATYWLKGSDCKP